MKAAVLYDINTPLKIERMVLPNIENDQVRIRLVASGVCHSDWHVIKGEWPFIPIPIILGHEGAGIVEEIGSAVNNVKVGDHVVLSWKRNCGLCDVPADQRGRQMDKFNGLGTFSTETIVPQDVVIPIDKEIPLPQAALVG